jgi:FkbM family methyltransferase
MFIAAARRRFAGITEMPPLARAQIRDPAIKPRGARRLLSKAAQTLSHILNSRLGLSAEGTLEFTCTDGRTIRTRIDAANSVYIDYQSREEHGGYEPTETLLVDFLLPKIAGFYDIGANWGYFTWLAATNSSFKGEIFSFEISPAMNAELRSILSASSFERIRLHRFGLSDRSGMVSISTPTHAHLTQIVSATGAKTTLAEVRCLDELTLHPPPDLIKIDVEDHEYAVLRGAADLVARYRPGILFECRDPTSTDSASLFAFLFRNGYIVAILAPAPGGFSLSAAKTGDLPRIPTACALFAAPAERLTAWFGSSSL